MYCKRFCVFVWTLSAASGYANQVIFSETSEGAKNQKNEVAIKNLDKKWEYMTPYKWKCFESVFIIISHPILQRINDPRLSRENLKLIKHS